MTTARTRLVYCVLVVLLMVGSGVGISFLATAQEAYPAAQHAPRKRGDCTSSVQCHGGHGGKLSSAEKGNVTTPVVKIPRSMLSVSKHKQPQATAVKRIGSQVTEKREIAPLFVDSLTGMLPIERLGTSRMISQPVGGPISGGKSDNLLGFGPNTVELIVMQKRDRPRLFADILGAIVEESRRCGVARITRVQSRAYVPFNRLRQYLQEMRRLGLIEADCLKSTEKGLRYLEDYKNVRTFYDKFGLN